MESISSKDGAGPVECSHCNRSFKNMPALNGHMRQHSAIHKERANHAAAASNDAQTPPALLDPTSFSSSLMSSYNSHGLQIPTHQATSVSLYDQVLSLFFDSSSFASRCQVRIVVD